MLLTLRHFAVDRRVKRLALPMLYFKTAQG